MRLSNEILTASSRLKLWELIINHFDAKNICEVGVWKGSFAENMLKNCSGISKYIMVDPWRNMDDWNKKFNVKQDEFDLILEGVKQKTDFAKEKRIILRGKTTEIINQIEDDSQDLVYIDGDHTLRGVLIDLIKLWPKVKSDGILCGDDFKKGFWSQGIDKDPTLVLPAALYFAEAMDVKIYALPFGQFIIFKSESGFEFIDMTPKKTLQKFDFRRQILTVINPRNVLKYTTQKILKKV